jgi:hypothetical protein
VIVDTFWGIALCASVAAGSFMIGKWLGGV